MKFSEYYVQILVPPQETMNAFDFWALSKLLVANNNSYSRIYWLSKVKPIDGKNLNLPQIFVDFTKPCVKNSSYKKKKNYISDFILMSNSLTLYNYKQEKVK